MGLLGNDCEMLTSFCWLASSQWPSCDRKRLVVSFVISKKTFGPISSFSFPLTDICCCRLQ